MWPSPAWWVGEMGLYLVHGAMWVRLSRVALGLALSLAIAGRCGPMFRHPKVVGRGVWCWASSPVGPLFFLGNLTTSQFPSLILPDYVWVCPLLLSGEGSWVEGVFSSIVVLGCCGGVHVWLVCPTLPHKLQSMPSPS